MGFNNGFARSYLQKKWEKLRIEYRAAGMSEDAIQSMYDFDVQVVNSEQTYYRRTVDLTTGDAAPDDAQQKKRYEKAVSVVDTYRETANRFAWIGEIEDERLLAALETLDPKDLELLTLYVYEGYTVTEISNLLHCSQPTISRKIKRIKNFLKKF